MPQIPERLVNFRCYLGTGAEFLGLTDVELPSSENLTETISGPGIAGEYVSPVIGHFGPQTVKLKWRTTTVAALALLQPIRHALDIRGSVQVQDSTVGVLLTKSLRIFCSGQTRSKSLGKLEAGKPMGSECDIECAALRVSMDGVDLVEFDKFNMIYKVFGVDYLAKVRVDMGGV